MARFDDGYALVKHQKTRTPTAQSSANYQNFLADYRDRALTSTSLLQSLGYEDQWVYTLFADDEYEVANADLQAATNEYIAYLFENQYL